MIYTTKENNELIITCDCVCGSGLLWKAMSCDDEGEQYFVSLIESSWYAKQTGRIRPYFKRLWRALRGKEYCLTELVMTQTEVAELSQFLHQLTQNSINKGESHD